MISWLIYSHQYNQTHTHTWWHDSVTHTHSHQHPLTYIISTSKHVFRHWRFYFRGSPLKSLSDSCNALALACDLWNENINHNDRHLWQLSLWWIQERTVKDSNRRMFCCAFCVGYAAGIESSTQMVKTRSHHIVHITPNTNIHTHIQNIIIKWSEGTREEKKRRSQEKIIRI